MTTDRRKPTAGLQNLFAGTSALAILIAAGSAILATSTPALAECSSQTPSSGATVTCDALGTESGPILAPGSQDVTVDFLPGAAMLTASSPAIDLGGGARITLNDAIVSGGPFFGNPAPTIAVGPSADLMDLQADITEITSVITVKKAQIADAAMNAIIAIENGDPVSAAPLPLLIDASVVAADGNAVFLDGSLILSFGSAGIENAPGSSNVVDLSNGSAILGLASYGAGVALGGDASALVVKLDASSIGTLFDGSPAIDAGFADSAAAVQFVNGSRIFTLGDDSPAIVAPADSSIFALEMRDGSADFPALATFGDYSPGVVSALGIDSVLTIDIAGIDDNAQGAGLQTHGNHSPVFELDYSGGNSSISIRATDSSFSTSGNESPVFTLRVGDESDQTLVFANASLASQGENSPLIDVSHGNASTFVLAGADLELMTAGDGSSAIVQRVVNGGFGSIETTFLSSVTIGTMGNDALGILIEEGGASSVRTFALKSSGITTQGDRSAGAWIGGMGEGSVLDFNAEDVSISTAGANSPAIWLGGFAGGSSVYTLEAMNLMLSTAGSGSAGFVIQNTTGIDGSQMTTQFSTVSIATQGNDAPGFLHGTFDASGLPNNTNSSRSHNFENLSISTQGDRSPGFAVFGFGDGNTLSDTLVFVENASVSTAGDDSTGMLFDIFGSDIGSSTINFVALDLAVETMGDRSHGIVIGDGQGPNGGITSSSVSVFAGNLSIATAGNDAVGLFVEPIGLGAVDSAFSVTLDEIAVTTQGAGSHGIVLGGGLGTEQPGLNTTNELRLTNVSSMTSGANAHALVISQGTTLTMDAGNLGATTADNTVVNGLIDNFDGFVATGPGGRAIHNEGILFGQLTFGTGVVGNISNNGLIESEGGAGGMAVTYGATADIFELQALGRVIGTVQAGNGTDTFILGGEANGSFDHSLIGTQYLGFDAFVKEDGSTWTLTGPDSAAPFLPGTITGGTLVVDATLDGFDLVNTAAGRLEGTGGVGDLTNGGAFAPGGMAIANFSVAGDLMLQTAGSFEVDIDGLGNADHVAVGGATTLGGTLSVSLSGFLVEAPTAPTYTIIISQDAIGGMFGAFADDLPDIDLTATVFQPGGGDPGRVVLGFVASDEESDKSVYANALYGAANAGRLFADTLIARARPSSFTAFAGSSAFADDGAGRQIAALPDGSVSDASNIAQAPRAAERRFGFWIAGLGQSIDQNSRGGRTGYDSKGAGVAIGAEAAFGGGDSVGILGIALAYSRDDIDSGASSADLDAWQAGIYAAWHLGAFSLAGALGYGWTDTDFRRSVVPGVTAKADTDGRVLSGSVEIAYDIARSLGMRRDIGLRIAPTAGLDVAHVTQDGFRERGAGILNLRVDKESDTQLWSSLGVAIGADFRLAGETRLRPELSLAWEHLFSGAPTVNSSLPIATGGFSTRGVAQARDRAAIGAGVAVDFGPTISAHLRYEGSFGSGYEGHRGSAGLSFRF